MPAMNGISTDIADLRREYRIAPLHRADLDPAPFVQFDTWFKAALRVAAMDPNAISIATVAARWAPAILTVPPTH